MTARSEPSRDEDPRGRPTEHDQDSDPPRTAVPPGQPKPGEPVGRDDPARDQDSDPPRTAVRP